MQKINLTKLPLWTALVGVAALAFWLIANVSIAVFAPRMLGEVLADWATKVHTVTTVSAMLIWLGTRRGTPNRATLDAVDAVMSVGLCLGWTLMVMRESNVGIRPEAIALLARTYTLVVRAALIPSTPARTALLSALSFGESNCSVWVGIDEDVAMIERRDELQVRGAQQSIAEHIATHIANADHDEFIALGISAERRGMTPHALPRTACRDRHHLVVVANAAT